MATSILAYFMMALVVVCLLFAFQWVFAFIPWLLGFLCKIIFYPLEIINQVIYPVWVLPYTIVWAFTMWICFKLIIGFFSHKKS